MSHPCRVDERGGSEPLGRPWAAVEVVADAGGHLTLKPGGVFIAKADSLWMPLPSRLEVRAADGRAVAPSPGRRFYLSAETFDPYHAVLEAPCLPLPKTAGRASEDSGG